MLLPVLTCVVSCFVYPDRPESWQPDGSSAWSLAVCWAPGQTGSWGSHQSDHRYSMPKIGSSDRDSDGLWWWKQENWYLINITVNKLTTFYELRYIRYYWASISIILLYCITAALINVLLISQNKSNFLLENWIALTEHCLFQKYCTACKYACITHLFLCVSDLCVRWLIRFSFPYFNNRIVQISSLE